MNSRKKKKQDYSYLQLCFSVLSEMSNTNKFLDGRRKLEKKSSKLPMVKHEYSFQIKTYEALKIFRIARIELLGHQHENTLKV